jgi:membrane protein DedA with SNARE-associated domain
LTEWFHDLLTWIEHNPAFAGWVVFGVSLAESLAIVGVLVPGVVILIGAGTLIGAGVLDFWSMCAWVIAGAIIGDGLSYWLGHHFEYLTRRWRWFRLHPDHLQKGIRFFESYGDLSIALGRFFGPLRAIVPLVAGLLRMPPKRFFVANVLSALVWAPAYLAPGILLGEIGESGRWRQLLFPLAAVVLIVLVWALVHWRMRRARGATKRDPA